jgi:hypothetical protein
MGGQDRPHDEEGRGIGEGFARPRQTARNVVENELSLAKGAEVKMTGALNEAKTANEAAEAGRKKGGRRLSGRAQKPRPKRTNRFVRSPFRPAITWLSLAAMIR